MLVALCEKMAESDGGDFALKHPQNSVPRGFGTAAQSVTAAGCRRRSYGARKRRGAVLASRRLHSLMANKNSTLRCTFSAPSHSTTLLQGLSVLRDQGQLLDVVLAVNEERFQMVPVVELCEEFLKSAMSVETCLHIGQMATTFSLSSLKESVDTFTFRHFLQIAEEEDFLHIPMERLVFFLQSNKLKNCSEIDLFHAAIRWLQYDESRRAQASSVLCHVRFPLMRSSELVDSVQTVDIMVEDVRCRQYLLEAFNYQILPFRQHEMRSSRTLIRSDVMSLITFGGTPYTDNDRTVSTKVYYLPDITSRQFKELTEMEAGCSHACVAVLDNFVYVVGGQHLQYRSGEGAVDSCFRYDPHLSQWLRIQPMQEARIQFQLNVLHGQLYATGGRNRSGSLSSVECYCPKKNEWTFVEPLKRRIWGHAGTPLSDQWDFRAPMNEPRVLHAMISCRDRVYALGGRMDHVDRCFDVLAVEYYVPENDQWTTVSPMRAGQSEAGCCLLDRKIYIVGGYNWHLNNVTSIVQVYNTETDEWERDLHFPESFAGIA
ncbi:hypothetical protein INR49_025385, partial [Caranx melampygus]